LVGMRFSRSFCRARSAIRSENENESTAGMKPCFCQPRSCCSEIANIRRTSCFEYC
jgi:hypothetical protein